MPARLLSKRNNIPRISVYINRNLQRPREQVLVDERRTPTWNLFLDQLTATVRREGCRQSSKRAGGRVRVL